MVAVGVCVESGARDVFTALGVWRERYFIDRYLSAPGAGGRGGREGHGAALDVDGAGCQEDARLHPQQSACPRRSPALSLSPSLSLSLAVACLRAP
eukprot:2991191-Rhodomonas_salina.3